MNSMTPVSLQDLDKDSFSQWLDSFDVVLADCDGVLWLHDHLYPRANEAINKFIQMKKKVYLITNNSQMSREDMAKKCQKMNFNLDVSNLISSSYATAEYLKLIKFDKTAYVIGTKVLANEIERVGIQTIGTGPDIVTEDSLTNQIMKDLQSLNEEVGAVVVGFDEHFSYPKLFKAVQYLRDENVKFIATNNDEKIDFPSFTFPETGPILSALENVTGRRATILGKPSKLLKDTTLKQELHRDSNRFLMIGDRLNTDIVFGKESNFQTLLVGTGVHKLEDVKIVANKIKNGDSDESLKNFIPDFYIPAMSDLLDLTNKL